jgi:hypothetical protein
LEVQKTLILLIRGGFWPRQSTPSRCSDRVFEGKHAASFDHAFCESQSKKNVLLTLAQHYMQMHGKKAE